MREVLAVSLLALCLAGACGPAGARAEMLVQVCFSPDGACASHILAVLDEADREIFVAMYAFTSALLAQALIRARARGVDVRVVVDAVFDETSHNSVAGLLARHGIAVAKLSGAGTGRNAGLMHQKFAVVDRSTVASGSYNWTHSADAVNYESLFIFRHAGALANELRAEFMRLWSE